MELTKELMVNAIVGKGFKMDYVDEENMVKLGVARFCGNSWQENWCFMKEPLYKLSIEELQQIYTRF